ncbi:unnamed protein product, partial [Iphiclides podalirius]
MVIEPVIMNAEKSEFVRAGFGGRLRAPPAHRAPPPVRVDGRLDVVQRGDTAAPSAAAARPHPGPPRRQLPQAVGEGARRPLPVVAHEAAQVCAVPLNAV